MILHLCSLDKFIAPFYEFLQLNFDDFDTRHLFYIKGKCTNHTTPTGINIFSTENNYLQKRYFWLIRNMNRANKIILHGLWDPEVLILLCAQPWLLKKCYWVIWGGDLYSHDQEKRTLNWWKNELFRHFVIKRIGHFVTHIKGDYELAKKWYGINGEWHECFMYPSNLYQSHINYTPKNDHLNILLGNSADPSNNHKEIIEKIKQTEQTNFTIFCPLSYGKKEYAKTISNDGEQIFGERFVSLLDFMTPDNYRKLLSIIDIGIFNHNRQQGMGNITALLGMGKKVFIRKNISTWEFLEKIGIKAFDVEMLDLTPLDNKTSESNIAITQEYFSKNNLIKQLNTIFQ